MAIDPLHERGSLFARISVDTRPLRHRDFRNETGVLASATSLLFSVVSGGLLCVVGCVATALALPAFLRYDSHRPHA